MGIVKGSQCPTMRKRVKYGNCEDFTVPVVGSKRIIWSL